MASGNLSSFSSSSWIVYSYIIRRAIYFLLQIFAQTFQPNRVIFTILRHLLKKMKKQNNYERYGDYIVNRGDSLGSGTYGKVYRGYQVISENSFGNNQKLRLQPVAIKQSYCEAENYQQINILKILNHVNIIRYIDYKIHGNSLFMVMELCEQGTLEDLLLTIPEDENEHDLLLMYFSQIISAIRFMYEKNILHRDIKPSNILVKDNQVKIADFGTSKLNEGKELRTLVGTPLFSSPELLEISLPSEEEESSKTTYTEKSDIWSLGFVLYLMFNYQRGIDQQGERLKASLPWSGKHAGQVLKNILTKPLEMKKSNVPPAIQQIIKKMLKISPEQRMGFKELLSLEEFGQKSIKHIKLNLSESHLALSQSFMPEDSMDNDFCLNHKPEEEAKVAEEIEKKQINWELMKLLQIKDSEHYEDDEIREAIEFYEMVLQGLNEVFEPGKDDDLLYNLEKKVYELQSWRLWNIDYQNLKMQSSSINMLNKGERKLENSTIFKIEKQSIQQILDLVIARYPEKKSNLLDTFDTDKFQKILQKPQSEHLISKEKVLIDYIKPSEAGLKNAVKTYIKTHFTEELTNSLQANRLKCNMNLSEESMHRKKTCMLIYDLVIVAYFEWSWKIKNKLNNSYGKRYNMGYSKNTFMDTFKAKKTIVNIKQVIARIRQAYKEMGLASWNP